MSNLSRFTFTAPAAPQVRLQPPWPLLTSPYRCDVSMADANGRRRISSKASWAACYAFFEDAASFALPFFHVTLLPTFRVSVAHFSIDMKEGGSDSIGVHELHDLAHSSPHRHTSPDANAIEKLHHKPTIPRTLDRLIGLVGVNSSVVSAWPIFFLTSVISLSNGGTAGLLVGVIVASLGMIPVYISLAEKIRRYPTAGGQYHWVAALAPPSVRRFLSFYCGFVLGKYSSWELCRQKLIVCSVYMDDIPRRKRLAWSIEYLLHHLDPHGRLRCEVGFYHRNHHAACCARCQHLVGQAHESRRDDLHHSASCGAVNANCIAHFRQSHGSG